MSRAIKAQIVGCLLVAAGLSLLGVDLFFHKVIHLINAFVGVGFVGFGALLLDLERSLAALKALSDTLGQYIPKRGSPPNDGV